ncbi:tetratricopeptide repeat protein [bacterium]|nr:tetratricopeptide repeat protein [bacterium]
MKKLSFILAVLLVFSSNVYSQTVYDDNYQENPNYLNGNKYLQSSQYSSAINEFKKAIRTNSSDAASLIGLTNAYNMRAQYYNNTVKDTARAISDIKSSLFFIKYYSTAGVNTISAQNLSSIENNLKLLEASQENSTAASNRLEFAKKARIKGEFAASAYDYHQIATDANYAFESNVALGDIYKIFNKVDKAIIYYKKAITINPNNSEVRLKLARAYEQVSDFASSLKEYDLALANSSENLEILSSLERIWQKKVDEFPSDAEAHANLGVVLQKQLRYNEALVEYKKAEELNPSNLNTKINIGTLYQEQKKYDAAINIYNDILSVQPYNAKVLVYKAECLKALKKNDDAINLYKTALNIEPKNTQIKAQLYELLKASMSTDDVLDFLYKNVQNSPMDANSYYEFAYELHKANKIDDAINFYLETIKLDNKKIDAYVNLSQAYRQKKNYKDAFAIIQKAKAVAPDNEQVKKQYDLISNEYSSNLYSIATNAYEGGEYQKAISFYKSIKPATEDSLIGIAASYQALSNSEEAIKYYIQAMELSPKNEQIPVYIASLYVNNNDNISAKKYIDIALNINPANKNAIELNQYLSAKNSEELIAQAMTLYNEQKYDDAIQMFDKILAVDSTNATVYYYRALSYDGLNNYQKAIEDYKLTLKYAPDMLIAYYSLAVDYDNLKKYKEAKDNYIKYVDASTEDNEYRQYAQLRIEEIK